MAWKPTPRTEQFVIRVYDRPTGDWASVRFEDLRCGDIYAAFDHEGQIDPFTGEPCDGGPICAIAEGDAHRNEARGQGYQIAVRTGPLDELIRASLN